MSFGTGAVKVTPAHDPNDFLCGRRHKLEEITIFTDEGAMAENTGQFAGMMRLDARGEVLKALKEKGLSRGEASNKMRLGKCSRTGDIIEPMLKPQWWLDCSGMAKRATDAVRNGELKIIPEDHKKTWWVQHGSNSTAAQAQQHTSHSHHVPLLLLPPQVPLAGQYPRLVHLEAAMVGPPHPRLLYYSQGREAGGADCCSVIGGGNSKGV